RHLRCLWAISLPERAISRSVKACATCAIGLDAGGGPITSTARGAITAMGQAIMGQAITATRQAITALGQVAATRSVGPEVGPAACMAEACTVAGGGEMPAISAATAPVALARPRGALARALARHFSRGIGARPPFAAR